MPDSYSISLPPELEYEIFMFALQNEVMDPTCLILVAKRVHDWLIPHLYHTVVIHPSRIYPPCLTFDSIKHHGHYTRHLVVQYETDQDTEEAMKKVLSSCPNISNLALWGDEIGDEIESVLELNQITRLSIDLTQFKNLALESDLIDLIEDDDDPDLPERIAEAKLKFLQLFGRITHAEITENINDVEDVFMLKYFTILTHLCVSISTPNEVLQLVFLYCPKLEVIVLLKSPNLSEEVKGKLYFEQDLVEVVKDDEIEEERLEELEALDVIFREKIVLVRCLQFLGGWENGARGGTDMWTSAEDVVRQRRQKRIRK